MPPGVSVKPALRRSLRRSRIFRGTAKTYPFWAGRQLQSYAMRNRVRLAPPPVAKPGLSATPLASLTGQSGGVEPGRFRLLPPIRVSCSLQRVLIEPLCRANQNPWGENPLNQAFRPSPTQQGAENVTTDKNLPQHQPDRSLGHLWHSLKTRMVERSGFEPLTPCMPCKCSTN